jgi:serine/threonine-protein kinase
VTTTFDEAGRAFLQERLAYLGRTYASIGLSFFGVANIAGWIAQPDNVLSRFDSVTFWAVPVACLIYLLQWLVTRGGPRSTAVLRTIDAAATPLVAACLSLMVFAAIPGELPAFSYARMLLLVTFGFGVRAIVVPSSPRRTLTLGVVALVAPVATSHMWYAGQTATAVSPLLHDVWTAMWCFGGVVIATLASHVIFGLRREVREVAQLGQYTLLEKIGEGGMGAVYRASHAMLRRPTAVKLLSPSRTSVEEVERFEREVQLTSRLTHPNTVAVFDYGRTPEGVFYYAMEYLEGVDLECLVRADGPQQFGRVVHILRQIAGSLTEAHGIGLIHRDIKPANVIMVAERAGMFDVAKVVDFGLVKDLDARVAVHDQRIAGTPHYLAPEAIASPDTVGPAADIYALGCVGYFLLTGATVFDGATVMDVCSHHLYSTPEPPDARLGRAVPARLSSLVMECLEKDPERRPASAASLLEELEYPVEGEPWTADYARVWWSERGATVRASVERSRGSRRRDQAPAGLSYIRPRPHRA